MIIKFLTKNYTKIPLFFITLNLQKYNKEGSKNSCMIKYHPLFKDDEDLKSILTNAIDYIRNNYDMQKLK